MGNPVGKRFIAANAIDGTKTQFNNNEAFRAKNNAGTGDIEVFKLTTADEILMASAPRVSAPGSQSNSLQTKAQLDAQIAIVNSAISTVASNLAQEILDRVAADTVLQNNIDAEVARATAREDDIEDQVTAETARAIAAEAAIQNSLTAAIAGIKWRPTAKTITASNNLKIASEGVILNSLLPFSDDDTPVMTVADYAVGDYILCSDGANSKLWRVYNDSGTLKLTLLGFDPLTADFTYIVKNDLLDNPGTRENRAIYQFDGLDLVKLGDFDWSLATGITLSAAFASQVGTILVGDSVETAIAKLVGNLAAVKAIADANTLELSRKEKYQKEVDFIHASSPSNDPSTPFIGQRIIVRDSGQAYWSGVSGLGANDIVEYNGSAWIIVYDASVKGNGALAWIKNQNAFFELHATAGWRDIRTVDGSTGGKALASDSQGIPVETVVTSAELAFLSGVTSAIQTQLNDKANRTLANLSGPTAVNQSLLPDSQGSRILGNLTLAWARAHSYMYRGPSATTGVNINSTAGSNQVTLNTISNIVVGLSKLYHPIAFPNGSLIINLVGMVVTTADNALSTEGTTAGYIAYSVMMRTEDEGVTSVPSGDAEVRSGSTTSGKSGNAYLRSGNASSGGTTGDAIVAAGSTSGTRGKVVLDGLFIDASSKNIRNLNSPINPNDGANKLYVDNAVGAVGVWTKETFVINSTQASNGFIDLGHLAKPNAIIAFIGRLGMHETEDYTVSTVGGVTRISWSGLMVGDEAPIVGDKLFITYPY